ncbi:MAG TPA: hypothetical protein H9815_19055 [Candidatus Ruania gallistercoris]|uniref:Secreted protein n=1 Tax=Candidatus Ruania gallistercoris TaxID=2838746 RepID=A0A9D2J5Y8_9MICO|nr:hypothetical protein [Candidatus Ruania gallistercoris]
MTTTTRTTRRRRLTTAFAVVAGLAVVPAGAVSAAPVDAAPSGAPEASSWQYKDWYYFEADCHDYGEFYVNSPYFDYDDYKCEYAGTWPGDYYNLYLR